MFQNDHQDLTNLKSQFATSSYGGRRTLPFAFTEHVAIMAANILHSEKAVRMSVYVVRTFIKLREMITCNSKLTTKLDHLEQRIDKQDQILLDIVKAMQKLLQPSPPKKKHRLGFYQNK